MPSVLDKLVVQIGADLRQLGKQYNEAVRLSKTTADKISKQLDSIGTNIRGVGAGLSVGLTAPILALGATSIKAASDAQEMKSKFNAVFKDLSKETEEWSKTTAKAINRSSVDLMGYLASLQDTFVPLGFARDQAAAMSKELTSLGVDLASFNNIAEDDAIDSLTSAIVGNHEAVRKFGVIITQATLKQELMRMGIEGGVQAATEQEKALARLNLIMASTSDAQGDAAKTSESFANQMKGFKAQLQEASITIGEALLPVATRLLDMLTNLAEWFNTLSPAMQEAIVTMAALAAALGPVLMVLGSMASGLGAIIGLAPHIMAAGKMIGLAISLAGGPITIIIAAIGALVAAYLLFKDEIHAAVKAAYEKVDEFLGGKLTVIIEGAIVVFQHLWETVKTVFKAIGQVLTGDFSGALETMRGLFIQQTQAVVEAARNILPGVVESAKKMYEGIKTWLVDKINAVFNSVKNKIEEVKGWFAGLYDAVVGNSYIPDMVEEIGDHMALLDENMVQPAAEAAKEVDGIFSTLMDTLTGHIDQFIRTGKFDFRAFAADAFKVVTENLFGGQGAGGFNMSQVGASGVGGLLQSVSSSLSGNSGLGGALQNLFGGVFGSNGGFQTPGFGGSIGNQTMNSPIINMHFPPGTDYTQFRQSESQIAAGILGALQMGWRNR